MFDGKTIQYKEYVSLGGGIVSHDEIVVVAHRMFEKHTKLRDIVRDRFRYILVDEYQDTAPRVVDILLDFLSLSAKRGVSGFFGDSMQSIYDDGVGHIRDRVQAGQVSEVKKEQNRRNPRLVVELANKLRDDGIVQHASEDLSAPNMVNGQVHEGTVRFFHGTAGVTSPQEVRDRLGWDFSNVLQTKELNLTTT